MKLVAEIGIDLGTANILVYRPGRGVILNEPTVVAVSTKNRKVLAVGNEAREMLGRTPEGIEAIRPLRDGVIADYTTTLRMLRYILDKTCGVKRYFRPRVVVCVPSGVTSVERRAVLQAAREAGAGEALIIEEPLAAAIGAGLPVNSPVGSLVVDIGGGTSDIAVISLGGIVASVSQRVGGTQFDDAIARHIRNTYNLLVGEATSEEVKLKIGSAWQLDPELRLEVRGRDLVNGLPASIELTSQEVREALTEPIRQIAEGLIQLLEKTPPELAGDIIEKGIVLTGGGALLPGIDRLFQSMTGIPVRVADNALDCVAIGTGRVLEDIEAAKRTGAVSAV